MGKTRKQLRPDRPLARKAPIRHPKKRFILVCEGLNTEPTYFITLAQKFSQSVVQVECIGGAGTPDAIYRRAIIEKEKLGSAVGLTDSFEKDDEVWAVFDRDEHAHYDEPIRQCNAADIFVARSNPCFEIWLILHIQSYEQPSGRHEVQKHLSSICREYDPKKGKLADFEVMMENIEKAEDRAHKQLSHREKEGSPFGPPSTTVYELTMKIRGRNPAHLLKQRPKTRRHRK